jgi:hypothetical protein
VVLDSNLSVNGERKFELEIMEYFLALLALKWYTFIMHYARKQMKVLMNNNCEL